MALKGSYPWIPQAVSDAAVADMQRAYQTARRVGANGWTDDVEPGNVWSGRTTLTDGQGKALAADRAGYKVLYYQLKYPIFFGSLDGTQPPTFDFTVLAAWYNATNGYNAFLRDVNINVIGAPAADVPQWF